MTLRSALLAAAAPYLDGTWSYPPLDPDGIRRVWVAYRWPVAMRGPRVWIRADERRIDCSTMTTSILMHVYPDAGWEYRDYADMQVFDGGRPDSPIAAVVRRGVGERVEGLVPERFHLVQGWRVLPGQPGKPSGHAFLVYDRGNGVLDVLESSSAGMVGPRWRTTTIAELRQRYPAALWVAALSETAAR